MFSRSLALTVVSSIATFLSVAGPASAATLNGGYAMNSGTLGRAWLCCGPIADYSETGGPAYSDDLRLSFSRARSGVGVTPEFGTSTAATSAEGSIDATTGEMKMRLGAERTGASSIAEASGYLQLTEAFLLTGSGQLTFYALADLDWAAAEASFSVNMTTWGASYQRASDQFYMATSPDPDGRADVTGLSGSVLDYPLSMTVDVLNAQGALQYFSIQMTGQARSTGTPASLDASHTATFFFETTGNLIASPATTGFLSRPAYLEEIAPVPLPAAAPLLMAGLGSLLLVRHRRKARLIQ